jgi:hypothetical protein
LTNLRFGRKHLRTNFYPQILGKGPPSNNIHKFKWVLRTITFDLR